MEEGSSVRESEQLQKENTGVRDSEWKGSVSRGGGAGWEVF